jgi:mevalonate kinase
LGGVVAYKMQPLTAEKLAYDYPLTAIYSGHKTPTVTAVQHVEKTFSAHPEIFKHLLQTIDACVRQGIQAIRTQDWPLLGQVMNIQQGLMESLGVNTPLLGGIVNVLRQKKGILGAKISGAGLGDCVIGLGEVLAPDALELNYQSIQEIPVQITQHGVVCEKI